MRIVGRVVLGNPDSIADDVRLCLFDAGYECGRIDVRSPEEHEQAYAEITAQHPEGWHHETDCVGRYFAVWSEHTPTEIMLDDGRVFEAEAGDVILIDNNHARHRPPNVARWFARAWHVRRINAV